MMTFLSVIVMLLQNALILAYAIFVAGYGSYYAMNYVRNNRAISNDMCSIVLGAIYAVGIVVSYFVINFITEYVVLSSDIDEGPMFIVVILVILNLFVSIVVPIVSVGWIIWNFVGVSVSRCPNCHYTKPSTIGEKFYTIKSKITKTTTYTDGSKKRDVRYEDHEKVLSAMKCPECGNEWTEKGIRNIRMYK